VLRNFDFPGAQELADRAVITNPEGLKKTVEGLPKQAQTIVAAMQQEMQAKDQQIQQLSQELKFKTGIEQMKDDGQTKRTVIQTLAKSQETKAKVDADDKNSLRDFNGWLQEIQEWHNQAEVNRQTKLDVAEIQVAGSLLNTHVEAEHEKKAAEKAIKAGEDIRSE
jgi:hypothetical protein